jgi:hypothetical protein
LNDVVISEDQAGWINQKTGTNGPVLEGRVQSVTEEFLEELPEALIVFGCFIILTHFLFGGSFTADVDYRGGNLLDQLRKRGKRVGNCRAPRRSREGYIEYGHYSKRNACQKNSALFVSHGNPFFRVILVWALRPLPVEQCV